MANESSLMGEWSRKNVECYSLFGIVSRRNSLLKGQKFRIEIYSLFDFDQMLNGFNDYNAIYQIPILMHQAALSINWFSNN